MNNFLHHLSALGFGWVAIFVLFDLAAVACVVLAIRTRRRGFAFRAFLVSAALTIACLVTTSVAVSSGIASATMASNYADASPDTAPDMANGISVAMNGAFFGFGFSLVAAVGALACLVMAVMFKPKPAPTPS